MNQLITIFKNPTKTLDMTRQEIIILPTISVGSKYCFVYIFNHKHREKKTTNFILNHYFTL